MGSIDFCKNSNNNKKSCINHQKVLERHHAIFYFLIRSVEIGIQQVCWQWHAFYAFLGIGCNVSRIGRCLQQHVGRQSACCLVCKIISLPQTTRRLYIRFAWKVRGIKPILYGERSFFCLISASLNRGLKRCLKRFCENYLTKLLSSVMIVCSQLELLHETVGLVSCGAMSLGFNLRAIVYQGSK